MDTGTAFIQTEKSVAELVIEWADSPNVTYGYSVIPSYGVKPGETFYHDENGHRFITCSIYNDWDWDYRWDDIIAEETAKAYSHLRNLVFITRTKLGLEPSY